MICRGERRFHPLGTWQFLALRFASAPLQRLDISLLKVSCCRQSDVANEKPSAPLRKGFGLFNCVLILVASSASSSNGSAAPTGTGCACLGDSSFAPAASESLSDSSHGVGIPKSLHSGTSMRSLSCRWDGNDMDCPRDGSKVPQVLYGHGRCVCSNHQNKEAKQMLVVNSTAPQTFFSTRTDAVLGGVARSSMKGKETQRDKRERTPRTRNAKQTPTKQKPQTQKLEAI